MAASINTKGKSVQKLWYRIKGNPSALARLFVFVLSVCLILTANKFDLDWLSDISNALLGASVAMIIELFVKELAEKDITFAEKMPDYMKFTDVIKNEMTRANFYRERQTVTIEADARYIRIEFRSKIVTIDKMRETTIKKQIIQEVAAGLQKVDGLTFRVGSKVYPDDIAEDTTKGDADDLMVVEYKIIDDNQNTFVDQHYWASLVSEYTVNFRSKIFRCEFTAMRGKTTAQTLVEKAPGEFISAGPALPGEILRWKLQRLAA